VQDIGDYPACASGLRTLAAKWKCGAKAEPVLR
jgi:hypothetical protein